jgi:nitrogen fixation protein NifU and related proteins
MALPYGATVLEHFRRPRNQRSLARAAASHELFNPLCGDRVRIELALEGETISDAAFTANACAICTASASLLTLRLSGATVAAALSITNEDVLAALGAELPAGRLECAVLPARAMRQALAGLHASA